MATADMNGTQASPFIKLFGTVIVSDESRLNKRPSTVLTEEDPQGDAPAPAKATAALPCPRCKSVETKFCYFNNYNVNQPRHFCKACHRYWTAGGALRNVPAGVDRRRTRFFTPAAVAGARDNCTESDRCLARHERTPARRRSVQMVPARRVDLSS